MTFEAATRASPPAPAPTLPRQPRVGATLRSLRAAVAVLLLALVALGLAWELALAPIGRGTLAIKVLPLVLALPGVLRHRLYTYRWLALLVWLYVLEGLVRAASERASAAALAAGEVVLALALFATVVLYIRRRLRGGVGTRAP